MPAIFLESAISYINLPNNRQSIIKKSELSRTSCTRLLCMAHLSHSIRTLSNQLAHCSRLVFHCFRDAVLIVCKMINHLTTFQTSLSLWDEYRVVKLSISVVLFEYKDTRFPLFVSVSHKHCDNVVLPDAGEPTNSITLQDIRFKSCLTSEHKIGVVGLLLRFYSQALPTDLVFLPLFTQPLSKDR